MPIPQRLHDGFLRVPLDEVLSTRMIHLISGLDAASPADSTCGMPATITGYTEWISEGSLGVSIGWDWRMDTQQGRIACIRVGLPRSNVMLVDAARRDYGWVKNLEVLATVVDAMPWSDVTRAAIGSRYPAPPTYANG